jgi:putative PEP-CTERM system histidine kinase
MTDPAHFSPSLWSFGLALLVLGGFAVHLALGWRGGVRASALLAVVVLSVLWTAAGLAFAIWESDILWTVWRLTDLLRSAGWTAFLLLLPHGAGGGDAAQSRSRRLMLLACVAVGAIALEFVFPGRPPHADSAGTTGPHLGYAASLGLAVVGLVAVEQLLRNTPASLRWGLKPLCIGLGGMYAFDLFVYADALLFGHLDQATWSARGAIMACVIPFVGVATARNREWTIDIAVSRQIVFHSTALLGSGSYLLVVAAAGYYVRYFGGSWGATVQVALLFAASLLLGVLLMSGTLRSKLRVFLGKHFFRYRYDYREEWLRVTNLLAAGDFRSSVHERAVVALADLVESPGGAVWLKRDRGFQQVGRWNAPAIHELETCDAPLPLFLRRTGWVIDLSEHVGDPTRYPELQVPAWLAGWPDAWLVVPLLAADDLPGFVVLANPRVRVDLNWEVRDLLKTAGRQAASYLGQVAATEALLDAEKFAAFNRMSAFVVHDLKNLVAQLALILKNAERHRANPEFQRDMLDTVKHAVERMSRLLIQLRVGTSPVQNPMSVDLVGVAERVCQSKSPQRPGLAVEADARVRALGHEERLEQVIGHLLQNAIDASESDGEIRVRIHETDQHAVLEIADHGVGMPPEFIQQRLFRPFQTTKRDGMGIGAYESYQYVAGLGGQITVESRLNEGTRVRVLLPRGEATQAASEVREAA